MDLFKGYVVTSNKKCLEKFKNRRDFKSYDQVKSLPEFAGILNDGVILIDVDDEVQSDILYKIVEDLKLQCRVYKTSRGKHFLFRNSDVDTCKTHTMLACGLTADIKLGSRNSYSILKFKDKEREILLDFEEYDELPSFLLPIKYTIDFLSLGEGDGRNEKLFAYILTLQKHGFSKEEIRECIRLINHYILKDSLPKNEIETILRDEAFEKPCFFDDKVFKFDVFGDYLIKELNIIRLGGQLHMYQDGVYKAGDLSIEREMLKRISALSRNRRNEVLAYLNAMAPEYQDGAPAKYIAFKNGILDINTGELLQFDPKIVLTNKINYDYDLDAYSEICDKALNKLAVNDENIRKLLEEVVGYCFYRRNELRKSFILIGDKANGKSTYLDMIKTMLGDENTSALDLSELGNRFKTAELFGKLANIGDDIGDEFIPNPAIFKKLVSGDRLNAERKGESPFDFNNYSKMLFSANNIPRIKDKSGAVIDRLIIVPFEARFSPNDPDYDPYIKYKLRSEESIEYLIKVGVEGLKRVLANNAFTKSDKVVKEIEEYEETNNPVILFFKELEDNEESIVNETTASVFRGYSEFCITNNFSPLSKIEFSKQVKKHYGYDIKVKKVNGKSYRVFVHSDDE